MDTDHPADKRPDDVPDSGQLTEKPEVTEEHKAQAKEMAEAYEEDRPTTKLPGSGGAVAGTAINDWVDDEGEPIYGQDEDQRDA